MRGRVIRLAPRSLQGRMLAVSAAVTLLALILAGWMMAGVLGRFVIEGLDRRLDAELALLASAVDREGRIDEGRIRQTLAGFEAGPGWQWRVRTPGRTLASSDFPALEPVEPPPPPDRPGRAPPPPHRPLELRNAAGASLHARRLTLETARGPVELTAAAPRALLRRPIEAALAPLLGMLALLAALLGGAAVVQLRLGLRPLRTLREQLAAIRAGRAERVDEEQPSELRPLAEELNALAAHNAATLAAARQSAANLAHALKTPIATLALDLRERPSEAAQVARIEATIRHHLARARMQAGHRYPATPLGPAVRDVVHAIERLHADRGIVVEVHVGEWIAAAIDPRDLDELLGNLLDNAARFARSRVAVRAASRAADARWIELAIEDDGPGMPAEARAEIGRPGVRLDESEPGYGFGLAIVRELTALYGGTLGLVEAAGGGLLVQVSLPAASTG